MPVFIRQAALLKSMAIENFQLFGALANTVNKLAETLAAKAVDIDAYTKS